VRRAGVDDRVELIRMVAFQWTRLADWRINKRLKSFGFVVARCRPIKWVNPARSPTHAAHASTSGAVDVALDEDTRSAWRSAARCAAMPALMMATSAATV